MARPTPERLRSGATVKTSPTSSSARRAASKPAASIPSSLVNTMRIYKALLTKCHRTPPPRGRQIVPPPGKTGGVGRSGVGFSLLLPKRPAWVGPEAVEVHEQERHQRPVAIGAHERPAQAVLEQDAVCEAGEVVVTRTCTPGAPRR